jgi:hypothetical protein
MKIRAAKRIFGVAILVLSLLLSQSLQAQTEGATLSGIVTDGSGAAVPNARISAKSLGSGETATTETDRAGQYTIRNLAPGDYEVQVSATKFSGTILRTALSAGATQSLNAVLATSPGQAQGPAGTLPNAPSSSKTEPSLQDLGFPTEQTQGNAQQQALLDKRTHMLKIHQRLGLITAIPLIATLVTSGGAGGRSTSSTDRTVHMVLGAVSSDLYFTSAYFAIRAPRVPGTKTRGPIRLHKTLAWIHGPGMILTPILGAMAYSQKSHGETVHGIASAHGPVAIVTAGAFGAALLSVSLKF